MTVIEHEHDVTRTHGIGKAPATSRDAAQRLHRHRAARPYIAATEQVWALHDAIADHLRPAILLGAFVGLRMAEVVGLRSRDPRLR